MQITTSPPRGGDKGRFEVTRDHQATSLVLVNINKRHLPLCAGDGSTGVLLIHGFTGSPYALRPWAEDLIEHGHRVRLPRLPGHGTTWQELNRVHWTDWYDCVRREFDDLRADCKQVFVAGLSMGGALALRLAADRPDDVAGLMLVNPAIQGTNRFLPLAALLKPFVGSVAGIASDISKPGVTEYGYDRTPIAGVATMVDMWRGVIADLPAVTSPLLVFRSRVDHVVPASSTAQILARVSSPMKIERVLLNSYHVATLDWDAQMVFTEARDFMGAVSFWQSEGGAQPRPQQVA